MVSRNLNVEGGLEYQEKQRQQQSGWSTLQIQILQELVGTARRMGDPVAAARHMAFVIQGGNSIDFFRPKKRPEKRPESQIC